MSIGVSTSTKPCAVDRRRAAPRSPCARSAQVALHARAAQVEVAVPQPQHLVGVDAVVDRERRRLGLVEHLERGRARPRPRRWAASAFTVPSGRCADRPRRPARRTRRARGARRRRRGCSGSTTTCTMPGGVAHVEEHDAAVVAAARRPSRTPRPSRPMSVGPELAGAIACASSRCPLPRSRSPQPARDQLARHLDLLARRAGPSPRPRPRSASSRPSITRVRARRTGRPPSICAFTERPP